MWAIFTKIDSRLWSDENFAELSVDGKLLFIYLLTCNHRNMIGLYSIPLLYVQADLGWTNETVKEGFSELLRKGFVTYNFKTSIVFIKNFLKYNPLENPNQVKGAIKVMEIIPTSAINVDLIRYLEGLGKPFMEPLIKLLVKGLGKQEEEDVYVEEEVEVDVEVDADDEKTKNEDAEKETPTNKTKTFYKPIIEYLNLKSGKNYKPTGTKTQDLINARLNDGFTLENFYKVIDIKVAEWKGGEYDKFLRPETLFSNKFEGYLNQSTNVKSNKHNTKFHTAENRTDNYSSNELEDVAARKRQAAREKYKGAN